MHPVSLFRPLVVTFGLGFSLLAQNVVSRFEEPNLSQGLGTYYGDARVWYRTAQAGEVLDGWLLVNGSVDLVRHETGTAKDGAQSLDLNGTGAGTIQRRFATVPGKRYRLDFDFSGNPIDGRARILFVHVNGTLADRFDWNSSEMQNSYQLDMKWQRRSVSFDAVGDSAVIELSSGADGFSGPAVDNLTFYRVEPPVLTVEPAILLTWPIPPWGAENTVLEASDEPGGPWESLQPAVQRLASDGVVTSAVAASGRARYYRIRSGIAE